MTTHTKFINVLLKVLFIKSNSLLMKIPKKVMKYSNKVLVLRYSPALAKCGRLSTIVLTNAPLHGRYRKNGMYVRVRRGESEAIIDRGANFHL